MTEPVRAYATWVSEDIQVVFSGCACRHHFGTDIEEIQIENITILGVSIAPQDLPNELLEELHALSMQVTW